MRTAAIRVLSLTPVVSLTAAWCITGQLACSPAAGEAGPGASVPTVSSAKSTPIAPRAPLTLGSGPEESAMDSSVNACTDFYSYACGGWIKNTPIPDDQSVWARSFSVINENNEKKLNAILESEAKAPDASPYAKSLGDFYATCMDTAAIDKGDKVAVAKIFSEIDALKKTPANFEKVLAQLHLRGVPAFFDVGSQQDFKDSTRVTGVFDQAGLGLPDRDYYLADKGKFPELKKAYEAHVAKMFELAGLNAAQSKSAAATVMKVETELAKVSMTKEDRRDPQKIYHLMAVTDLPLAQFDINSYLGELGFAKDGKPTIGSVNVSSPAFFTFVWRELSAAFRPAKTATLAVAPKLESKLAAPPAATRPVFTPDELLTYLKWQSLHKAAPYLSTKFVGETFGFYKAKLKGIKTDLPRWKKCVRATDGALGEALAIPFVKEMLGEDGKKSTLEMIQAIEAAMKRNLSTLQWMDEPTRAKAQEKLSLIANKIGYPDRFRNYDDLKIGRGSYLDNMRNADEFESKRQLAKIGKPVDRNEWQMTPPMVNAYYDASMNEMVFPAGILQPPFYSTKLSQAVNFGGIGMVMGHELTHGFDDEGRQFDGHGNLTEWCTPTVAAEFTKRASCVERQYSDYVAVDDMKVNGKLTLGENIADLGGLKLSFAAVMDWLSHYDVAPSKYTPAQQFFLGYAQSWCSNIRPEELRVRITTDPHSPAKFRVNGPLSNLPEFAKAFSCKAGDAMVRGDRCEVW